MLHFFGGFRIDKDIGEWSGSVSDIGRPRETGQDLSDDAVNRGCEFRILGGIYRRVVGLIVNKKQRQFEAAGLLLFIDPLLTKIIGSLWPVRPK
jgi:hypothetical protein